MLDVLWNSVTSRDSSFGERIAASLALLFLVITGGLVSLLVLHTVDVAGIAPVQSANTVITAKEGTPASTSYVPVGKTIIPQGRSATFRLYFDIEEKNLSLKVMKGLFEHVSVGDRVVVQYGFGRISKGIEPLQVEVVPK